MRRALIVKWAGSGYDSLMGILDLAARELAADGCEIREVVLDSDGWKKTFLERLHGDKFSFALGMTGIGAEILFEGKRVWEILNTPFFTWFCDHPARFSFRHKIKNPYVVHGFVFPDHARFGRTGLNRNDMLANVHIGIPDRSLLGSPPIAASARNARLMFTKSGADLREIEAVWRKNVPDILLNIVFGALEELWGKHVDDYVPVITRHGEDRGIYLAPNSYLMREMIYMADDYLRAKQLNLALSALREFPVDLYGVGWDHFDFSNSKINYRGSLNFQEMMTRLPSYLGSLSTNPFVDDSVHDRVFFALAAGVVPLSDANRFSAREFPHLRDYSFHFDAESIAAAADAALSHPKRALDAVEACHEHAIKTLSMRQSVRRIEEICALHTEYY